MMAGKVLAMIQKRVTELKKLFAVAREEGDWAACIAYDCTIYEMESLIQRIQEEEQ